ncbi:hypothetical protein OS493_011768 [Desmophyllum pertusum]|uniref:Uncharacterized protein n=1 Tax=Desmophyllum pertusum TaxID=174260 RepID=A0A9W9YE06_9CNID|nr:hypothetical protein OS493_011768 [Desmophyllum pertusum]
MGRFLSWMTAIFWAVLCVTSYLDVGQAKPTKVSSLPEKEKNEMGSTSYQNVGQTKRGIKTALAGVAGMSKLGGVKGQLIGKAIEIGGEVIDKQLENYQKAQDNAADFLNEKIQLDITPDMELSGEGWEVPEGYHLTASMGGGSSPQHEAGEPPYIYQGGIGQTIMNGCWGTGYQPHDPCYKSKTSASLCKNMIDGAAFIGVGFDGNGEYSPESRRMSIVQRNCANKATYDDLDVPDTMNVHGIYDTAAYMYTFDSKEAYKTYLQDQSADAGHVLGFNFGVKKAFGIGTDTNSEQFMAQMNVDIDR